VLVPLCNVHGEPSVLFTVRTWVVVAVRKYARDVCDFLALRLSAGTLLDPTRDKCRSQVAIVRVGCLLVAVSCCDNEAAQP
jgi:hypothetical protein